ncbi:ABC transporter ATP-binding protein [Labrys miyagiensis]|uniref:ABC transporter ATP-binding protein n=1 Tax=Labrys miyagiensis TaxID=346912 RepID=A0ABQ6CN36_9HYPH|nr:ABC transporter ATP-binding protein [Labrys miyagiensis]GLS21736.1 ABC transporter ATP-binding protein [Labrys miyagiensis]
MAFLEISNLKKSYGPNQVVKHFELSVQKGEFITLLGPSGCGKTTVLRMVAGFETPTSGSIRMDAKEVTSLAPNQRNVGMVFQAYALFPNMTIAQNIGFGMKIAKKSPAEIAERVKQMLDMIKLPHIADRYPFQLSGGQQQRVALARAIAMQPKILLLDEPLSALDAKIRVSLRDEIRVLQQQLGITTLFVTHDQEEALSMSDRIVVMSAGQMEQVGTPFEVYNFPKTSFVSSFVGHLNYLTGTVTDAASGRFSIDGQEVVVGRGLQGARNGETRRLALRPETVELGEGGNTRNTLRGKIDLVSFLGSIVRIHVNLGSNRLSLDTFNTSSAVPPKAGDTVALNFGRDDLLLLEDAAKAA